MNDLRNGTKAFFREIFKNLSKADVYEIKAKSKLSGQLTIKRKDLGMNQKDFAKFLGVSQGMVSKWESGNYNFTFRTAAEVCEKIGYTFEVNIQEESALASQSVKAFGYCSVNPAPLWKTNGMLQKEGGVA